jgi:hypothetical protein
MIEEALDGILGGLYVMIHNFHIGMTDGRVYAFGSERDSVCVLGVCACVCERVRLCVFAFYTQVVRCCVCIFVKLHAQTAHIPMNIFLCKYKTGSLLNTSLEMASQGSSHAGKARKSSSAA